MTSVYVRKPRNVRSIYARPPSDRTDEIIEPADQNTSVCQNGSQLNQKSSRLKTCGRSARSESKDDKQPVKNSISDGGPFSRQEGGSDGKRFKRGDGGGAATTPQSKGISSPTRSKRLEADRTPATLESSISKCSSSPTVDDDDELATTARKRASSFARSTKRKAGRLAAAPESYVSKGSSKPSGDVEEPATTPQKASSSPTRCKRRKVGRPPTTSQGSVSKGSISLTSDVDEPSTTPAKETFSSTTRCRRPKASRPSTASESSVGKVSSASRKSSRRKAGRPSTQSDNSVHKDPSASSKSRTVGVGDPSATTENGDKRRSHVWSKSSTGETDEPTAPPECHVSSCTLNRLKHKIQENSGTVKEPVKSESRRDTKSITKLKPYVCEVCQRRYASDVALREHERIHAEQEDAADHEVQSSERTDQGSQYKCDVCNKVFTSKGILTRHRALHSDVKPFVCDTCGKCFSQGGNLKIHMLQHTGERPFVCNICNKTYLRNFDLQQHKRIHTGEKPYTCKVCKKAFIKMDYLKTHKQVHNGIRPFKCDQCSLTFRRNNQLKAHKRTHAGVKSFVCVVCNKAFSTNGILKTHMHTHMHKKEPGLINVCLICDICGAQIGRKSSLKTHKMIHTGERPYVCGVCNKGYITKNEWLIHKRTHTGERPFVCRICDASYPRNANLQHHIRTVHLGKKPHACDVCSKAFSDRRTLKEHKLIHKGIRPHKCGQCGKCFTQSGSLKTHMRTHTGEKPFACNFCSKRFSDVGGRNRHVRIHTGEKPYKCSQCPASFARPEPYKQHRESVHGKAVAKSEASEHACVYSVQTSSKVAQTEGGAPDTTHQPSANFPSEAVVVIQPPEVMGVPVSEHHPDIVTASQHHPDIVTASQHHPDIVTASHHNPDIDVSPVMMVQPMESYQDTVSSPACDIPSGPTIVVESTEDLVSTDTADQHILVNEHCIYTSGNSVICEPLPCSYSTSQIPSGSEAMEYAVVEYSDDTHSQFTHEEHEARHSVIVKPEIENKDMMPRIIEVQVRNSREGMPPKIIEVIYDGTIAPMLSVAEPESETELENITSTCSSRPTDEVVVEYGENGTPVAVIESQSSSYDAANIKALADSEPQTSHDMREATAVSVIESQGGVENAPAPTLENLQCASQGSGKAIFLTVTEHQSVLPDGENVAGPAMTEPHADFHDAENTTTLEVIGSQTDSYHIENAMTVAFIESQVGSECSPNYFQVFQADGTGNLTIIESPAAFDNATSDSVLEQVAVGHVENASRIIDLPDGKSIHIITGEPAIKGEVIDDNTAVEDQKPFSESLDQEEKYSFMNTNKRFNRKGNPTAMSVDASVFGDVMKIRKRTFGKAKKSWICEVCGNGFTQYISLKKHMAVQHNAGDDQTFVCSTCGKACVSQSELMAHSRRHTGERPFSCDLCSNTYKHKADLRQHILAGHMGKRPHVCSVCGKSFTEKRSLKDHQLIHQGIRPHKCVSCGKAFTQSSSLKNHMRVHSGLRPWVCQYCGKDFTDQSTFTRHQRIHTGEKPYQCQHCSCTFARSEQMKKHLSKEHPGDLQNLTTLAEAVATIM